MFTVGCMLKSYHLLVFRCFIRLIQDIRILAMEVNTANRKSDKDSLKKQKYKSMTNFCKFLKILLYCNFLNFYCCRCTHINTCIYDVRWSSEVKCLQPCFLYMQNIFAISRTCCISSSHSNERSHWLGAIK